ncbi:MAG: APC family permease, partial [Methylocystis sp.]|nr:APC family permease [Methylocystis sp.]
YKRQGPGNLERYRPCRPWLRPLWAALVAAVGLAGPAALSLAFAPMLGVAIAFALLNHWRPEAGAVYAWVRRALSPSLGVIAGWSMLSLSSIFMVAAALPAGVATLDLIAPQLHDDVFWVVLTGAGWFLAVLALVTIGVTASAHTQAVLSLIEVSSIFLVSVLAIKNAHAAAFSWSWFAPTSLGSFEKLSAGLLVAVYFFFGWDVSANLAEETANAKFVSGLGGVAGVLAVFALFLLAQVAVQMTFNAEEARANAANILPALGRAALPAPWSSIAILAVLLSALATIETQLLQCTRLLFSMARDGAIHASMGRLHPKFQTPWIAGFAVAAASLLLFAASSTVSSVGDLMSKLISAVGIQISFYYTLAAICCAVVYRREIATDWRYALGAGVVPAVSALIVGAIGVNELPRLGWLVSSLSVGCILIGLVPLWFYRRGAPPDKFDGDALPL